MSTGSKNSRIGSLNPEPKNAVLEKTTRMIVAQALAESMMMIVGTWAFGSMRTRL